MTTPKLPKFPLRKKLSSEETRQFRHAVSQLKKRGLVKASINSRVASPGRISGGKTLVEIVNKHRAELKTLPPKATIKIKSPALAPKSTIKLKPLNSPLSIRDFSAGQKTLAGTLAYIEKHADELDRLKRPDEKWAFQLDGMKSYVIFSHIEDMVKKLRHYQSVKLLGRKHTPASDQFYDAIKLVRWNKTATEWKPEKQHMNKRQKSHAENQARHRRKKK
jgi:hypothetical protein